ncbi:MAG: adenylosuccinate lyase [Acidobacteriota bacterium]|nr:adenylosuccinate lyase [Acidobacteriota bacterium]
MIPRYTNPEIGALWSDQRKYDTWLQVEVASASAMAEVGLIPEDAARDIAACPGVHAERVDEIERTTQHDVIAFTTAVAEQVGSSARWLHFGLTSSDVLDTALALQMREACGLILTDLQGLLEAVAERAREHRDTPMIGRTHGVHAEPMTFGLKLALWYEELRRNVVRLERAREIISVGKISGAVGTYAHLEPDIEQRVCAALGLTPAPVASQVVQRDRHAELLSAMAIAGASVEKFALEVRGLQKTEIGEVEEGFAKGQKGSSAMPHKRNPIGCEQLTGLARVLRANAVAAFENVALWHERDISHSSVERVIIPDSFIVLDHMLRRFTRIVRALVVHPDRMLDNLGRSRGVVFSGTVLLELAKRGVSREQAYEWVQRTAMRSHDEQLDFKTLLAVDADVMGVLSPDDLEQAFDLDQQLRHVGPIVDRVLADLSPTTAAGGLPGGA